MHLSQVLRAKKKREEVSKTYINKLLYLCTYIEY